jgi:acetylglutamate kinase
MNDAIRKADVLIEALSYIRNFRDRLTVIKLGGSAMEDPDALRATLQDVVFMETVGMRPVVVHGGGAAIDRAMDAAGLMPRKIKGRRYTDDATLKIVVSVLGGTVNKMLVSELAKLGVRAAGFSGCDGGTLIAAQHPPIDGVELGHVGKVKHANRSLMTSLLAHGAMPVISSIAIGEDGQLFNVNADTAAAAIAVAAGAKELLFITDVAGLLDADGNVVPRLHAADATTFIENVTGGMKPKLQAALSALTSGVGAITIGEEGGTTLVAA